jgi:hypothetical protein
MSYDENRIQNQIEGGLLRQKQMEMSEPIKLSCGCDALGNPVFWNEFNEVVQCHRCGAVYQSILTPAAQDSGEVETAEGIVEDASMRQIVLDQFDGVSNFPDRWFLWDQFYTAMHAFAASRLAEIQKELERVKAEHSSPVDGDWKLVGESYQIADTGDYDGHYEITNGKITICTNHDDEEALQPIVDALNRAGCSFYTKHPSEVEAYILRYEVDSLKTERDQLRADLSRMEGENKSLNETNSVAETMYSSMLKANDALVNKVDQLQSELAEANLNLAAEIAAGSPAFSLVRENEQLKSELAEAREENVKLKRAIHWALGYTDFHKNPPEDLKPYWWRTELRERSGLTPEELDSLSHPSQGENEIG